MINELALCAGAGYRKNYYKIDEPAVISFSGGSTSAFMLYQILQAFNGKMPSHIKVAFANTGLEHPKTLDFVERCSIEWNVEINWLEYNGKNKYKIVNYATASRNGGPFNSLIEERKYLPNTIARFCTVELKIKTIDRWSELLFHDEHIDVIGLRYDEPHRVSRIKANNRKNDAYCPMYYAKHTHSDVINFWNNHQFRLEIPQRLGNCVGCFLKGKEKLLLIAKENPELLEWWAKQEENSILWPKAKNKTFRNDRPSYRNMISISNNQQVLQFEDDDTLPCNCTD